jgi:hypothetical protein
MQAQCQREVVELHGFLMNWLTGAAPRSAAAFARFADVLADGFALISPRGVITERRPLLRELEAAHGIHRADDLGFRIEVRDFRQRFTQGALCLVTYEEWQHLSGSATGRRSSAWFRTRSDTPHGVEWLHVHETWLPDGQESPDADAG